MRRRKKIRWHKYQNSERPNLHFVVNYREAGKRKRSFFETKEQAATFVAFKNAELERNGREGMEFSTALRVMAQECAERLKPFGKTIDDAVDHYVTYLEATERSITVDELVDQLIDAKEADGMSQRYIEDLQSRLSRFAETFGGQMVATITTAELDDWLRALDVGPQSRNNFRRVVITLLSYAVEHGYAASNPAEKTSQAKVIDKPPGILTVTETAHLLEASSPALLPYIAIGAFAGLRRAEIARLDWSEIDFTESLIEVTAEKSKTASRRFVKMQPNLREWLLPVRKHRGPVICADFAKEFYQARVSAGIKVWPGNALRHSFASYHLARFRNAAELALEIGHTNSAITFAHYRELVRPKDAEQYWNIMPAAAAKKIVHMTPKAR
jgi:integrase